jgi:3-deoxy-manno-octulosonate cytidylyltransferase (CMP-KDO synthetase)
LSKSLSEVYIATCDEEIMDYARSIGAKSVMTKDTHERASDRVAEALLKIEDVTGERVDILTMIQGDEPMLLPQMVDLAVEPLLKDPQVQVVNLMGRLKDSRELEDSNQIKVVVDNDGFALYFSREPIPSRKKAPGPVPMHKQVCIIPFRRDFLIRFSKLRPTPLEIAESIDMLRILEHGYRVKMAPSNYDTYSVDTMNDLENVEAMLEKDPLLPLYRERLNRV